MKRSGLIKIYCVLTLSYILMDMIFTRNVMKIMSGISGTNEKKLIDNYQLVYTKVLLLLDVFYYASFCLEKRIDSMIQLKIVKTVNIAAWFIIACESGFTADFFFLFSIQVLSLVIIKYYSDIECEYIYLQYNHKISADLNTINMHIVSEVIKAIKSATTFFVLIHIFEDFTNGTWNHYSILVYLKAMTFIIDRALQRRNLNAYVFNITSVLMFSIPNIYGIYYVYTLFRDGSIVYNEMLAFLELTTLIMNLLMLYYLYLYRTRRINYND
ncbi:hypothetical protein P3W45_000856 [Vairimorpha bombi]|jgi:hypothetical protein